MSLLILMKESFSKATFSKAVFSKAVFLVISGIACVLFFSACVMPHSLDDFSEEDEVQLIVSRGLVDLYDETENRNLVAGYRRIRGLNPDNYYIVEVVDEYYIRSIWFVSRDGFLVGNMDRLGRSDDGTIIGLRNDYTYTVHNARALTGMAALFDPSVLYPYEGDGIPIQIPASGRLQLPYTKAGYFLNLHHILPEAGNFTIIRVPVLPDLPPPHATPATRIILNGDNAEMLAIELPGENEIVDFVFFAKYEDCDCAADEDNNYNDNYYYNDNHDADGHHTALFNKCYRISFRVLRVATILLEEPPYIPEIDNDSPGGDLPGGDLPGGDLPGGDLPGGDLPGGDLPGGDLPGGDLPGGDLPGGDLPGGDLPGGDLPGGDLPGGDLPGGDLPGGDLPGGDLPGGDLPGGDLPGGDLPGGDLPGGDLPGDDPGCDLPGGDLPGTSPCQCVVCECGCGCE